MVAVRSQRLTREASAHKVRRAPLPRPRGNGTPVTSGDVRQRGRPDGAFQVGVQLVRERHGSLFSPTRPGLTGGALVRTLTVPEFGNAGVSAGWHSRRRR
jgi:hypothetical protein